MDFELQSKAFKIPIMSDQPRDNDNATQSNDTNDTGSLAATFSESEKNAQKRIHLCRQFLIMANYYRESIRSNNQRCAGPDVSEEDRETASSLRQQWQQDIVKNEAGLGLNEVSKVLFLREVVEEMGRLEGFDQPEASAEARAAWTQARSLFVECHTAKENVDSEVGTFTRPRAGTWTVD